MREVPTSALQLRVPLEVEVGPNWDETDAVGDMEDAIDFAELAA